MFEYVAPLTASRPSVARLDGLNAADASHVGGTGQESSCSCL